MAHIVSLHTLLDGAGAPEWVHLVPAGTFKGVDGRGPYVLRDPAQVIAASMAAALGGKLPLDENHSTDIAAPKGGESPARGWITALEMRQDGIWGHVEWTEEGRKLVADHAYRGISPVFQTDKSGKFVERVLRAALTNTPNLGALATLSHQEPTMDLAKLRLALGLPADADEAAVLAAVERQRAEIATHGARIAELTTQLQTAVQPGVVTELQAQLNTLRTERARDLAVAYVDGAIAKGKPIAVLRDHYIARHMQDAAAVEKELGAMFSINAGGLGGQPMLRNDAEDGDGLTEMEAAICHKMGLDRKKYAEECRQARKGN